MNNEEAFRLKVGDKLTFREIDRAPVIVTVDKVSGDNVCFLWNDGASVWFSLTGRNGLTSDFGKFEVLK